MALTVTIENDNIKLKNTNFATFNDLIEEIEDYKFWKIIEKNNNVSFDINILENKYLW